MMTFTKINKCIYQYCDDIRDQQHIRNSFNALSQATFDLNFEAWYQMGYWQDAYRPHVLMHQNQVVANVSLNLIETTYLGTSKIYGQIGTVMTAPAYRGQGLANILMQRVLSHYLPKCDALYLYANAGVVNFYPRYGFVPAHSYQHRLCLSPITSLKQPLDMSHPNDVALLRNLFQQGNRFSELPLSSNWGLLMFYCSQFLNDCVYYLPEHKVVVIVAEEETHTCLYDIYGHTEASLETIMAAVAKHELHPIMLGFTPHFSNGFTITPFPEEAEDRYLFVYQGEGKDNPFIERPLCMPLLSDA